MQRIQSKTGLQSNAVPLAKSLGATVLPVPQQSGQTIACWLHNQILLHCDDFARNSCVPCRCYRTCLCFHGPKTCLLKHHCLKTAEPNSCMQCIRNCHGQFTMAQPISKRLEYSRAGIARIAAMKSFLERGILFVTFCLWRSSYAGSSLQVLSSTPR